MAVSHAVRAGASPAPTVVSEFLVITPHEFRHSDGSKSSDALPAECCVNYSFLNDCTGLPIAALMACQAMVANAIAKAIVPASMNITGPMVIR